MSSQDKIPFIIFVNWSLLMKGLYDAIAMYTCTAWRIYLERKILQLQKDLEQNLVKYFASERNFRPSFVAHNEFRVGWEWDIERDVIGLRGLQDTTPSHIVIHCYNYTNTLRLLKERKRSKVNEWVASERWNELVSLTFQITYVLKMRTLDSLFASEKILIDVISFNMFTESLSVDWLLTLPTLIFYSSSSTTRLGTCYLQTWTLSANQQN